ncbi:MAG TPA: DUF1629 domain-containing protein [Burkholderiales bacterium]|nr:DUF1629 domain-containing protein [Burkholderiales bacterium]
MRFFRIWLRGDRKDASLAFVRDEPEDLGLYDYCPRRGERMGDKYPKDAKVRLDPKSPGIKLGSLLGNLIGYLMVNTALKDVILEVCKCEVEVLPFTLYNHKKRVHSTDYWIINPIGVFDCVNRDASTIQYVDATKAEIAGVEKLVFDPNKMAAAPDLFRVPEDPMQQFISERLAKAIKAINPTNVLLMETELQPGK